MITYICYTNITLLLLLILNVQFHTLELQNATTPTSDKATLDASWKMLLALNTSRIGANDDELLKNTDKDMTNKKMEELQSRINTLENDLKKSKGDNY